MTKTEKNVFSYLSLYVAMCAAVLIFNYEMPASNTVTPSKADQEIVVTKKSYHPDYVRGIYLTAYSAGNDSFRQSIIEKMSLGKINTVVIDIKDYSGYILYDSQLEVLKEIDAVRVRMADVKKIIEEFHEKNIYVIARQTVFQDPVLARAKPDLAVKTTGGNTWYDKNGLSWVDPGKKDVWEYNLAIAKEATELGFDEINFDYMRYPSDGNMTIVDYQMPREENKASMMKKFFAYLDENLSDITTISIDTFGLVLDHTDDEYDLNIGQRLADAAEHFDYVCPMMYPSHYPLNYLGFSNSAEHPYAVIAYGLDISSSTIKQKKAKLRPWLQAFNIRAVYDEAKIDAQALATEEASTTEGWLLWNARNYYPDFIFQ